MTITKGVLALLAVTAFLGVAFAQTPPPGGGPVYDPNQFPAFNGRVQQFTLTPRGDIDGFIMADGTEVKTPPHLSTQIAVTLRSGDAVTVRGLRAAALPLIEAVSVTNDVTGQTVVDYGPPRGPKGRRWWDRDPGQTMLEGRVRMTLHGPRGDVNGALLEDGTIVRLPPPEAARFLALLSPGQTISVQGELMTSVLGRVMDATAIGPSSTALNQIGGPPAPPPGGPRG